MMLAGTRARLVPLPFVRPPLWSGSCSRRVRQRFNRTMAVNRRTNAVIRAVNSLSNCDTSSGAMFPSVFERARPDYFEPGIAECLRDPPSGVLSYFKNVNPPPRAQVRLVAQIFKSASDYVCRLGSSPSSDDVAEPGLACLVIYLHQILKTRCHWWRRGFPFQHLLLRVSCWICFRLI